jgi:membrane-bound inhibitor of C-type lysozyme
MTSRRPPLRTNGPVRVIAGACAALCVAGHADSPALSFSNTTVTGTRVRNYRCLGERTVSVAYIATADGDAFAYLPAEGRPHVFVSVLVDAGVTYVSGPYAWKTDGTTATLSRIDEPDSTLLAECTLTGDAEARPPASVGIGRGDAPAQRR